MTCDANFTALYGAAFRNNAGTD